jgi:molybdate transport system substrate-binding protein
MSAIPTIVVRRLAQVRTAKSVYARAIASAILMLVASPIAGGAAEIRLLSAASIQEVFKEIIGDFERESGHKVIIHYGTMGAITEWMRGGEEADLVISSLQSVSALVKEGKIEAASQNTISKVGVGMVVPSGAPVPAISSVEDFLRALIAAKTVIYADPSRGGAAGIHIARLIQELGIAEQLKSKIKLAAGGDVTEVTVAQGTGALGMTQISEIVGKPGAVFVGPLPEKIPNYTFFAVGRPVGAREPEAVTAFLQFLKTPRSVAIMKEGHAGGLNGRGCTSTHAGHRALLTWVNKLTGRGLIRNKAGI